MKERTIRVSIYSGDNRCGDAVEDWPCPHLGGPTARCTVFGQYLSKGKSGEIFRCKECLEAEVQDGS